MRLRQCLHCKEYFARFSCGAALLLECDCPRCQGYCECPDPDAAREQKRDDALWDRLP